MRIEIPFKTPSINHLYWHRGNIKIMKTEAKELRAQIAEIVPKEHNLSGKILKVICFIYEDWYYQNGDVSRKDIANREKFLIDSVFKALDIDDKYIFEHTFIKMQSMDEEKAVIEIVGTGDVVHHL